MDKKNLTMWSRIIFLAAWLPRRCSWKLISTLLTPVLMSQLLFYPAICSPQSTLPQLPAYSAIHFVSLLKKHILKRTYSLSLYIRQEVMYFTYDVCSKPQFQTSSELVGNKELETTFKQAVWSNLMCYLRICLEGLRKMYRNVSRYNRPDGRDFKLGPQIWGSRHLSLKRDGQSSQITDAVTLRLPTVSDFSEVC